MRLFQIPEQVVGDDEWHAIIVSFKRSLYILKHFGEADNCIPLTLFYRLGSQTVGLSEILMRVPVLTAGIASLIVFPLLVRGVVGPRTTSVFAWLLALSPLHVYFSRYARPYAISLFFVFLSCAAFHKWWAEGRQKWNLVYVGSVALAAWFHLIFLPAALAPLLFGVASSLWPHVGGGTRRFSDLLKLSAWTFVALLFLLGPPFFFSTPSLLARAGKSETNWFALNGAMQLLVGSASNWVVGTASLLALVGMWHLLRERRQLFLCLSCVSGVQIAAIMASRPLGIDQPMVVARYGFALLPILLLLMAQGMNSVECSLKKLWTGYPLGVVSIAALTILVLLGPLGSTYYYPNAWTNHGLFQYGYTRSHRENYVKHPATMPGFYETLRQSPRGSLVVVEAPWRYEWHLNAYPHYQKYHRQRVKVGSVVKPGGRVSSGELPLGIQRYDFRNMVHVGDGRKLSALKVDYVIFHKRLPNQWPRSAEYVSFWLDRYRAHYGGPSFEDDEIVVYKVKGLPPLPSSPGDQAKDR